jgi:hypothetical protein
MRLPDSAHGNSRDASGAKPDDFATVLKPSRHFIVYPALTRKWEEAWRARYELG